MWVANLWIAYPDPLVESCAAYDRTECVLKLADLARLFSVLRIQEVLQILGYCNVDEKAPPEQRIIHLDQHEREEFYDEVLNKLRQSNDPYALLCEWMTHLNPSLYNKQFGFLLHEIPQLK